MGKRIPLHGKHITPKYGRERRGVVIQSSDCDGYAPPASVQDQHRELQRQVDRRRVPDGEQVGWIEYNEDLEVTDYHIEPGLLKPEYQ